MKTKISLRLNLSMGPKEKVNRKFYYYYYYSNSKPTLKLGPTLNIFILFLIKKKEENV